MIMIMILKKGTMNHLLSDSYSNPLHFFSPFVRHGSDTMNKQTANNIFNTGIYEKRRLRSKERFSQQSELCYKADLTPGVSQ